MAATRSVLFAATASWSGVTPEPRSLSTANRSTDDDDVAVLDPKKESIVLGLEYGLRFVRLCICTPQIDYRRAAYRIKSFIG